MTTNSINSLIEQINIIHKNGIIIVGIDGYLGSGKTTLSNKLSKEFDFKLINLDEYENIKIPNNLSENGYVNSRDYNKISSDISTALLEGRNILIEGICLMEILNRIKIQSHLTIYVKRIDVNGKWKDEDECNLIGDPNLFIKKRKAPWTTTNSVIDSNARSIYAECIAYHQNCKPIAKCDIILRLKTQD